ncbi:MAG: 4Fe-4S binding protein [Chloroflexi bacterium]|nr:4Fe-4S binding protein [Chloroflexota bacterium]
MTGTRWKRARQITQVLSVALFFFLALLTFRESSSLIPLDVYLRLDPFAAFSAMLAARVIIPTMLLAIVAIVFGFVFGRAWCGWLCPLGAILDGISPRSVGRIEPHAAWRQIKYVLLSVAFFAALLGNLSLLILDPITILNRTFGSVVMPALNVILVAVETALYSVVPPLQPLFDIIEQNYRGTVLPAQQTFYQLGWMIALFFIAIVGLNWVASRFWCRYLCPLGAIYALQAKISWLRPRAVKDCSHCAACMKACPTSAITVKKEGFTVDSAECIVCMDCVTECPESVIAINFARNRQSSQASYDFSRRHFIGSAFASIGMIALFKSAPTAHRDDAFLVRPPGARENNFLDKCIRCGECTKVCPTGGLQPTLFESGLEGLWSPILVPRIGYCDFSCNACGQICPTGAIPPLTLEDKRKKLIGVAYIDQNRCIPWAMYRPCVVCEEMCPLSPKAIRLEDVDAVTPDGKPVHLQRPHMIHDLCIGCGICEYQCPQTGVAAIRVYVPKQLPPIQSSG